MIAEGNNLPPKKELVIPLDKPLTRSMMNQIRDGWGISEEDKKLIMQGMVGLALSQESSARDRTQATKNLIHMEGQDRKQEDRMHGHSINIGGSVVIGADAVAQAIRSRMALAAHDSATGAAILGGDD